MQMRATTTPSVGPLEGQSQKPNDLERLEVLDAEARAFEAKELGLLDGVLGALLLLLLLRQALVAQRLLQLGQPLLPLHGLSDQVAVVVLQRHLPAKRKKWNQVVSRPGALRPAARPCWTRKGSISSVRVCLETEGLDPCRGCPIRTQNWASDKDRSELEIRPCWMWLGVGRT